MSTPTDKISDEGTLLDAIAQSLDSCATFRHCTQGVAASKRSAFNEHVATLAMIPILARFGAIADALDQQARQHASSVARARPDGDYDAMVINAARSAECRAAAQLIRSELGGQSGV